MTQEELNSCKSIADVCRFMGWVPAGGNYKRAKKLIQNLDSSHFTKAPWNKGKKVKGTKIKKLDEILVKDSSYKNTNHLRERLIKEGYKLNQCEICGFSTKVELHHINGDPCDNRLENLQILCPNCHSQTENFRGKNKQTPSHGRIHQSADELTLTEEEVKERAEQKKISRRVDPSISKKKPKVERICLVCGQPFIPHDKSAKYCSQECYRQAQSDACARPDVFDLIKSFKEIGSFTGVAKKYNVTDNSVRKWCKFYKIPIHTKEMENFIKTI